MFKKLNDFQVLVALVIIILGIGTVFYHFVENWSWIDAYYFCVVTLATIGYGDLTPITPFGKIFTTFYIFVGVGIIGLFINAFIRRAGERRRVKQARKN